MDWKADVTQGSEHLRLNTGSRFVSFLFECHFLSEIMLSFTMNSIQGHTHITRSKPVIGVQSPSQIIEIKEIIGILPRKKMPPGRNDKFVSVLKHKTITKKSPKKKKISSEDNSPTKFVTGREFRTFPPVVTS